MNTTTLLSRSSNFGSSKNFTVMFRFYVSSLSEPGATGTTVVVNGTAAMGTAYFWAIFMNGTSSSTLQFQFLYTNNGNIQSGFIIGPPSYIEAGKWYHIAVKVVDNGGNNSIFGFTDGIQTSSSINQAYVDTAVVGPTRLGNAGFGQAQSYQLTEFVFIEEALTNEQIRAYASSPYI